MAGMKNAFGHEIPSINEIVTDSNVKKTIEIMLSNALIHLGLPHSRSQEIVHECLDIAARHQKTEIYEEQAHNIIQKENVTQNIPTQLSNRADVIHSQVTRYLLPNNLLDYGCGDARISELISKDKRLEVKLTDVYEHPRLKATGLVFKHFRQGGKAPFPDAEFNNILALAVFHHSSNPEESIKDVARLTKPGGQVIVIESVYGVNGEELPLEMKKKLASYLQLSFEQQRLVNVFFDHFYNRILSYNPNPETQVNVPFNFNTPGNWKQLFALYGLRQKELVHLGLDTPFVPEYHTLHVLSKT